MASVLVFTAAVTAMAQTQAHGGGATVQQVGQTVAGHDVTVMTAPKRPRVGAFHVAVQLIEPRELTYVATARLSATARHLGESDSHTESRRSRYREPWHELDLHLDRSGRWKVTVTVVGPEGRGALSFVIDIPPPG